MIEIQLSIIKQALEHDFLVAHSSPKLHHVTPYWLTQLTIPMTVRGHCDTRWDLTDRAAESTTSSSCDATRLQCNRCFDDGFPYGMKEELSEMTEFPGRWILVGGNDHGLDRLAQFSPENVSYPL